ncbi:MAG: DUF2267 domain-containing protein [Oculatellaceae cyanobacterium Prado106]|jgi:uncharacterized protein (DUF2267 family)|nr:DUF2267 domain-containing protein [Oculatellaceae cyanobacterium Prado106]
MKYDEFIKKVQDVGQIESKQAAEQAIRAVFETIAERILGDEASDLAAQLPADLGQYLQGHEGENGDHFPLREFYQRVSKKASLEPSAAAFQTRAVFIVLGEAVTPGEWDDVKVNFSDDYTELFETSQVSQP